MHSTLKQAGGSCSAIEVQGAYDVTIAIGSAVPDFALTGVDGKEYRLSDFRGTKVMVCFYRYTHCPLCAYSISQLAGRYKKLAWASKLKVITVFRTDLDYLRIGLTSGSAPIPRLCDGDCYPFLALADPDGTAGSTFQVQKKASWKHMVDNLGRKKRRFSLDAVKERYFTAKDAHTLLPSEFLINEEGVLVDVLRAEKINEAMSLNRITHFLLHGKKQPLPEAK